MAEWRLQPTSCTRCTTTVEQCSKRSTIKHTLPNACSVMQCDVAAVHHSCAATAQHAIHRLQSGARTHLCRRNNVP